MRGVGVGGSVSNFVDHITTRDRGDIPGLDSCQGPLGCPGAVQNCPLPSLAAVLWRIDSAPQRLQHSGECAPAPPLSNTVELTVVVRARAGELPQGMSMGELDPPLLVIPSSL